MQNDHLIPDEELNILMERLHMSSYTAVTNFRKWCWFLVHLYIAG